MFSGLPGLSGRRCLSIIRVAYMWNPTVCRDQKNDQDKQEQSFPRQEYCSNREGME